MKTKVVIDLETIRKYYLDLFIVNVLWVMVLTFLIGTFGFVYFLLNDDLVFAITLEAFTIIFIVIMFIMNRNNLKIAENEFIHSINEYEIEFNDEMVIKTENRSQVFSYKIIKTKKLIHFIVFKVYDVSDRLIYIIPKDSFSKEDMNSLLKKMKEERRV